MTANPPRRGWFDAPHITTDVSKRVVGLNEKFYDTVKISGRVARGSYVKVQAYSAVPNEPDTSVPLLLDQTIQITNEQAGRLQRAGVVHHPHRQHQQPHRRLRVLQGHAVQPARRCTRLA